MASKAHNFKQNSQAGTHKVMLCLHTKYFPTWSKDAKLGIKKVSA